MTDIANCGACKMACAGGQLCTAGKCVTSCAADQTNCKDTCVNLLNDPRDCGACGTACDPGKLCSAGMCAADCAKGWTDCTGTCQNLAGDAANCGKCGNACAPGHMCLMGACVLDCGNGKSACGDSCVDLQTDPANCGKCANACPNGNACVAGSCQLLCNMPLLVCGQACIDPRYDPANCGKCGNACAAVKNGAPGCSMGKCVIGSCSANFADCDARVDTGCEADLIHDAKNCGACGRACGLGKSCCGGFCLADLTGVDCTKAFGTQNVLGAGFGMGGVIDQLIADMNGLSTTPANQNPPPARSPYVWIAMHGTAQMNKVDVKTGAVLGTYPSRGHHPSRVAVGLDNSVWVGNRGDDCPDDPTCSNVAQILPDGTPGCTVTRSADGKTVPFVRAIAIDANGFVWFGTWNDARLHKVDPATCKVLADYPMSNQVIQGANWSSYPYGLSVDKNGVMWNSALDAGTAWFAMDTRPVDPMLNKWKYATAKNGACSYGIVIDQGNNVYMSLCAGGAGLHRIDGKTQQYSRINPNEPGINSGSGCGITIDLAGDIYQAGCSYYAAGNYVYKYAGLTGNYLGAFTFPAFNNNTGAGSFGSMFGIAGDTYGKIWVTDRNTASLCRFDATGKVEVQTKLPGSDCYNYSDWNAIVLKTVTSNNAQAGTWTRDFDAGGAATWLAASWDSVTPPGTSVAAFFKAAKDQNSLAAAATCGPFYTQPVDLTACSFGKQEWLEVTINLNTNGVNNRPSFNNFKVFWQ
jgi:streptogramin lyase